MKKTSLSFLLLIAAAFPRQAAQPQLKYAVIISRHGVRSPTWNAERLNQYSSQPWPDFGVPPGDLTPHGRQLITLMGGYYRAWLAAQRLLPEKGCEGSQRVYIWADTDQRTLETGRALAQSLMPGCGLSIHSQPGDQTDPLFSGIGTPDSELSLSAVRTRLGADPQKLVAAHRAAIDALQFILTGLQTAPKMLLQPPSEIGVSRTGKGAELTGPFSVASTLSENLLLEYANGFEGANLGWGRLTHTNLNQVLALHGVYADLMRRTPYLARARGSNLLAHVLRSLEQAASGKPAANALGEPGGTLLLLAGHDTNLSNLAGMLGLSWNLPDYQPDETPPGGALIFSLWRDPGTGHLSLKLQFLAQTLDQMRQAIPLSLAAPPPGQDLPLPGCEAAQRDKACPWETARKLIEQVIDPQFTSLDPTPAPSGARGSAGPSVLSRRPRS